MKRLNRASAMIAFTIIILETLPYGAVLNFGEPAADGSMKLIRRTYFHFSLTPFGYADFGPFLTAVLSCILFCFSAGSIFIAKSALQKTCLILSALALLTSLMPLLLGLQYYSVCGLVISALLAAEVLLYGIKRKGSHVLSEPHKPDRKK